MGKVFIIANYSFWIRQNYDKYIIGSGDDWSKFEITFLKKLSNFFFFFFFAWQ